MSVISSIDPLLAPRGSKVLVGASIAVLRASMESELGYVAGYPGAPTASVLDVLRSYSKILDDYGVYFESSTNESAAAAKLVVSSYSDVRGMVNWKVVGNHVAADVLSHVAAMGVRGGAVILVGEDVGTDSTTIEVRTEYFAHGLGLPVLDPPAHLESLYRITKHAYELSEHASSPVYLLFRTMIANSIGSVIYDGELRRPPFNVKERISEFRPDVDKVAVPPRSRVMNAEKYSRRLVRAAEYARREKLNILLKGSRTSEVGFITHGSVFNSLLTVLQEYGHASSASESDFDILSLILSYPPSPEDVIEFARDKRTIYIVEQGAPPVIEDSIRRILSERFGSDIRIMGKHDPSLGQEGFVPVTGELTVDVLDEVVGRILLDGDMADYVDRDGIEEVMSRTRKLRGRAAEAARLSVPRTPTFCPGCPERSFFTLAKRIDEVMGRSIYAGDIGCYSLSYFDPFGMYDSVTGMGSSLDVAAGMSRFYDRMVIATMGDGTFYHKGVANVDNFVHNYGDEDDIHVLYVLFENYWTAMTGHQENPATIAGKDKALNMAGKLVRRPNAVDVIDAHAMAKPTAVNPYDLRRMTDLIWRAYRRKGVSALVVRGECSLARSRREAHRLRSALSEGKRVVRSFFQVHPDLCDGCFACERYIGCPSTGMARSPSRGGMVRTIDPNVCTSCGICGITALYALCPATYEVKEVLNPNLKDKFTRALNDMLIGLLRRL